MNVRAQVPNLNYSPTKHQMEAHLTLARYRLFTGPTGCGKTTWLCAEGIRLSLDIPGNCGYLCRYSHSLMQHTTLVTLLSLLPATLIDKHDKQDQLIRLTNGSEIYYGGLRQIPTEDSLSRIMCKDFGWFGIDDVTEVSEYASTLLTSRLRLGTVPYPQQRGMLTSNLAPLIHSWLKRCFAGPLLANSAVVDAGLSLNPYLPSDYARWICSAAQSNVGNDGQT